MKKLSLTLSAMLVLGAVTAAQAGGGSHTPQYVKPAYINPEDWKLWQKSMDKEDWERWRNSVRPEEWEAWQAGAGQTAQSTYGNAAALEPAEKSSEIEEADSRIDHWQ